MNNSTRRFWAATACLLSLASCQNKQQTDNQTSKNHQQDANANKQPNIIIIFTDDQGYADVSCFGGKTPTPQLDKMAKEGMKFTDFYVPSPSSAPSRNALMTGCYPARNYVTVNKPANAIENLTPMTEIAMDELAPIDQELVKSILPKEPDAKLARHSWGLPQTEVTIPEMLKTIGYSTIMYGKWHLGEYPQHHATEHGFDEYFGVPQSISVRAPHDYHPWMVANHVYFPNQPFYINDSIVDYQVDSSLLIKRYTEHAVQYIKNHKDQPFFMYLAHPMPHVPIGASPDFKGHSGQGLYADVLMEVDWSVGEILQTLKAEGMAKNTLVIFTSDNGPWLAYGDHAGSAKPLREGKGTQFEGGVREPTIAWWPGTIPTNSINSNPAMTIDLLPTFAEITGAKLPQNKIDGKSILNMLKDPKAQSPQEAYYFFRVGNLPKYEGLIAMRKGDWKIVFPHRYKTAENKAMGKGGTPVVLDTDTIGWALFNLRMDIGERNNLAEKQKDKLESLKQEALQFKEKLESEQRGVDWVVKP